MYRYQYIQKTLSGYWNSLSSSNPFYLGHPRSECCHRTCVVLTFNPHSSTLKAKNGLGSPSWAVSSDELWHYNNWIPYNLNTVRCRKVIDFHLAPEDRCQPYRIRFNFLDSRLPIWKGPYISSYSFDIKQFHILRYCLNHRFTIR